MVVLWLETKKKGMAKVSMKLMAFLAQARAEVGVVAKADQYYVNILYLDVKILKVSRF